MTTDELAPTQGLKIDETSLPFEQIIPPEDYVPDHKAISSLAVSINKFGLINSLVVAPVEKIDEFGPVIPLVYKIIAGRKRYLAIQMLTKSDVKRWQKVSCRVVRNFPNEASEAVVALIENHRRSQNIMSDAKALGTLVKHGFNEIMIQELTSMTTTSQKTRLRLNYLKGGLKNAIRKGLVTPSKVEAIARLNTDEQAQLFEIWSSRKKSGGNPDKISTQDFRDLSEWIEKKTPKQPELFKPLSPEKFEQEINDLSKEDNPDNWKDLALMVCSKLQEIIPASEAMISLQVSALVQSLKQTTPKEHTVDDQDREMLDELGKTFNVSA